MDTVRLLMESAQEQGRSLQLTSDPDDVVSAVYVKVQDGYTVEQVTNALNLHIRKVEAVQTKSMLTGISDSLAAISSAATAFMVLIWVLAFAILLAGERKREFAVLRMMGASRRMLSRMVLAEAACLSPAGGFLGVGVSAALVFSFRGWIEMKLGLPFLTPSLWVVLLMGIAALLITLVAGLAASSYAAFRLSRVETGTVLREGN